MISIDYVPAIEILEGHEYRYQWIGLDSSFPHIHTDPEEIFQPDATDGRSGRLRPGLSTGSVQVVLRSGAKVLGHLEIEVRSRKLTYQSEYRWMLRDIAERMTELVMDRFAPSEARFTFDETRDSVTLYQRFTFLRALLEGESFQIAIGEILRRPHVAWEVRGERVRPGAGMKASSDVVRQLSRAGPRIPWESGPIVSVPSFVERRQTEATHDTQPNRFVKFALEHWRQVIGDIDRGLSLSESAAISRGRREVASVLAKLDEIIHHELFSEIGQLTRFPADDQVLQKREGYRDVFKAYVEFELAARLSWNREPSSFSAGQHDVATLYEYWAFIQLAQIVAKLVGQSFDMSGLLRVHSNGLNVVLRSGVETVLRGEVERHGRRMSVELCFNRTFGASGENAGSWTRPMRPDYSLHIAPSGDEHASFEPVLLHFDAKYRVDFVEQLFGFDDELVDVEIDEKPESRGMRRGGAVRSDLLKMHAYRDAIRRTAGAYVLYPGGDRELDRRPFTEYHELLPGLGAFVLRPSENELAKGTAALARFLDAVFDHVGTRVTEHERGRYWMEEIYGSHVLPVNDHTIDALPLETSILLGYVKDAAHWSWINRRKTYNVRTEHRVGGVGADAALLQSQLLLLYCPGMRKIAIARIVSAAERISLRGMQATEYPNPRSDYWCVQLSWVPRPTWLNDLSASLIDQHVQEMGLARGHPVRVSWGELHLVLTT